MVGRGRKISITKVDCWSQGLSDKEGGTNMSIELLINMINIIKEGQQVLFGVKEAWSV
jgi:hypothetical protein